MRGVLELVGIPVGSVLQARRKVHGFVIWLFQLACGYLVVCWVVCYLRVAQIPALTISQVSWVLKEQREQSDALKVTAFGV